MPTKNTFVDPFANNNILNNLKGLQGQVVTLQGNKKADTAAINGLVIDQYAQLIPAAISVGVTVTTKEVDKVKIKKGKLKGGKLSIDNFKSGLKEAKFEDAVAKKRYENTIKAIVAFEWDKNATNLTPDGVRAAFENADITSEAKLAAYVKQGKVATDMEALAQRLFGKKNADGDFKPSKYKAKDWEDFDNAYRALKAARLAADKAADEAMSKSTDENDIVDSAFDAIDAA